MTRLQLEMPDDEATFVDGLSELLHAAERNGVDIERGWECCATDEKGWEVEVVPLSPGEAELRRAPDSD